MGSPHPEPRADHGLGVLVIRALTETKGDRPMVVEVLEVDPAGHDRILLVTSSSRLATRAVRDWLEIQESGGRDARPKASGETSRRAPGRIQRV